MTKTIIFIQKRITYAGNHGLEVQHADGTAYVHPLPEKDKENLAKVKKELQEQVQTHVKIMTHGYQKEHTFT